jgi:hypothetical protein
LLTLARHHRGGAEAASDMMTSYDDFRTLVVATTIDGTTLLSTDYFNIFNEVTMLLGMLPDMPEMLEDVAAWRFRSYAEHFRDSGLPFAPLAIEAYAQVPPTTRERFEETIAQLRATIDEARETLSRLAREPGLDRFKLSALDYAARLQALLDTGSAIVHGAGEVSDQGSIDAMF